MNNTDELPHDVILSIQRVLDIQQTEEIDRLDGLSERFNAVEILNDFFPDGGCVSIEFYYKQMSIRYCSAEASLAHLEDVSTRLADTHEELQKEVDVLQAELKRSQDPERMSTIQEMISVRRRLVCGSSCVCHVLMCSGFRICWARCRVLEKRRQNRRR